MNTLAARPATPVPEIIYPPEVFMEAMRARRAAFLEEAIAKHILTQAFVESGVLDKFPVIAHKGRDPVIHIARGDWCGGPHHLDTYMRLDVPAGHLAAVVSSQDNIDSGTGEIIAWRTEYESI